MNEAAQFEIYEKKLQNICDENNLIYTFHRSSYPISLTIKPSGDFDGQMSLLEEEKENEYTSVNASLRFFYNEGDDKPTYKFSEDFTISESLLAKLKNLFVNMCRYWWRFFFRNVMEKHLLDIDNMPDIESAANLPSDLPDNSVPLEDLMDDEEALPEDSMDGPAGDGNYPEDYEIPGELE